MYTFILRYSLFILLNVSPDQIVMVMVNRIEEQMRTDIDRGRKNRTHKERITSSSSSSPSPSTSTSTSSGSLIITFLFYFVRFKRHDK